MISGSTFIRIVALMAFALAAASVLGQETNTRCTSGNVAAGDEAYPPQLSGTVVDASGAVIAGAIVQVLSANGAVRGTTQTDRNGSFTLSGLPAGNYHLVISNPGFDSKETPVTIGTTAAQVVLRIPLDVGTVSTTINVQGREDDLIGMLSLIHI